MRARWLVPVLLAAAVLIKLALGHTYYAGEILHVQPLWFDWLPRRVNYDLIDSVGLYYPHDWLYNRMLHEGRLLLWNPYNFCGQPIYPNGASAYLYPPKLLLHAVLSATWAHDLYLFLHLVGMGVFFQRWMRALGLSTEAARVGAAAWMLNGFVQTWLQSEYSVTFGCWLPLLFERLWVGLGKGPVQGRPLIHATLILGLMGYAGHAQFIAHMLMMGAAWTLCLVVRGGRRRKLWLAALPVVFPLFLMAPQMLPILELSRRCERPPIPLEHQIQCFQNLLWTAPLASVCPDVWGSLPDGFAWRHISRRGSWVQLESAGFVGICGLICFSLSRFQRHRPGWKPLTVLWLLFLFVPPTPLYRLVCLLIPPLAKTMATRWLFSWLFLTCTHIGFGAESLREGRPVLREARLIGFVMLMWGAALLALALHRPDWGRVARWGISHDLVRFPYRETFSSEPAYVQAVQQALADFYAPTSPVLLLPLVGLLGSAVLLWRWRPARMPALLALLCTELLLFSWKFNTTVPRSEFFTRPPVTSSCSSLQPGARCLSLGVVRPNTGLPLGLTDVGGQDSLYSKVLENFFSCWETGDPGATRYKDLVFPLTALPAGMLDAAAVGWVLTYPNVQLPPEEFTLVDRQQNGIQLYRRNHVTAVAYVTRLARPARDLFSDLKELRVGTDRPRIEGSGPESEGANEMLPAEILRWAPGEWRLRVHGPGWLVVRETFDPGWQATVDGAPVTIRHAEAVFQAISLPPGDHEVRLSYVPVGVGFGLILALLGGSVLALLAWREGFVRT